MSIDRRITFPEGAVADALAAVSVEVLREDGDELVALCPGHKARTGKEDHNPSWSINSESGTHYCFSCGYKGNLFSLVKDLKGEGAARDLYTPFERYGRLVLPEGSFEGVAPFKVPLAEPVLTANFKPESWLDPFVDPPTWALAARNISAEGARQYEVRWDADEDRWILPLRDPDTNRLWGYQSKSQRTRYFRNRPRDVRKSHTFFGWPTIPSEPTKLVVVESPLDAVLLSDCDVHAVASCGSRISDEQIELLASMDWVYLWLDNDTAGELEVRRLRKVLVENGVRASYILPEDFPEWQESGWKDVGEMPDEFIGHVLDATGL